MSDESIFTAALAISDPDARAGYLKQACADNPALRREVEGLLAAHLAASPLDHPPVASEPLATTAPTVTERSGTIVGPYKLLQQIGEGGFGVVFMAEQERPVRRTVALKIIKAGMDTAEVIARFEAERQALALMDHPNIAKVLDAGATESSRPYFVMELVKGVPITEFCDRNHMPAAARLKLFIDVCHAIQHAHHKGVIHRDIKPTNVMVTLHDGVPVVKVIDFGVAKATAAKLTERTLFTAFGQMIGTPAYMSPEQAEMSGLDIDTRSDVYSLGVLLYELLTGTTPLEIKRLRQAGFAEMQRLIREVESPRPSTRLSSLGESATVLAGNRGTDPKQLARLLSGDLDWIAMKALEKDRNRRYGTPGNFAEDVDRYLRHEAILARPPSTAYKLKKFAQRNRTAVLTVAAILFVLLAGIAGTTLGLIRTEVARRAESRQRLIAQEKEREALEAAGEERQAREREAAQRAIAVEQRTRAEKARDRTRDVLDAMTSSATGDSLSTQDEISDEQKKFLTEVLTYYREFAGEKADDEQSRARIAKAALSVASIEYRLGRQEQGIAANQTARDAYQTLAADFPAVPAYRQALARSHNNLGWLLDGVGKRAEAEGQYRQALAIKEKLAADFPAVPTYRQELAINHDGLGILLAGLGQRAEAEGHYRQALAIQEKLTADFPAIPAHRRFLALSHDHLGFLLERLGQRAEAEQHYRQALAIQEKLTADFPTMPDYRLDLAGSHSHLGSLLKYEGQRTEAEEQYRQALAIREKLAADFPSVPDYQIGLGGSYRNYGIFVREGGQASESLGWFDKAIATLAPVHRAEPLHLSAKQLLRNSHWGRAIAFDAVTKPAEAVKDWDRAIELSPPAAQLGIRARRATSRLRAGLVGEAVAEIAELIKKHPAAPANDLLNFARFYAVASGRIADKEQAYADRAMELLHKAVQAGWKDAAHMTKDNDLDALRDREDFKKLLAELAVGEQERHP